MWSRGPSTKATRPKATSICSALYILQKEPLSRKVSKRCPFFLAHEAESRPRFRRRKCISPIPISLKYAPFPPSVRPVHLPRLLYHGDGTKARPSPFLLTVSGVGVILELSSLLTTLRQLHFTYFERWRERRVEPGCVMTLLNCYASTGLTTPERSCYMRKINSCFKLLLIKCSVVAKIPIMEEGNGGASR